MSDLPPFEAIRGVDLKAVAGQCIWCLHLLADHATELPGGRLMCDEPYCACELDVAIGPEPDDAPAPRALNNEGDAVSFANELLAWSQGLRP